MTQERTFWDRLMRASYDRGFRVRLAWGTVLVAVMGPILGLAVATASGEDEYFLWVSFALLGTLMLLSAVGFVFAIRWELQQSSVRHPEPHHGEVVGAKPMMRVFVVVIGLGLLGVIVYRATDNYMLAVVSTVGTITAATMLYLLRRSAHSDA